ncbi:putative cytosolic carboxypeptidase 6, partial [Triplophysa rosa]
TRASVERVVDPDALVMKLILLLLNRAKLPFMLNRIYLVSSSLKDPGKYISQHNVADLNQFDFYKLLLMLSCNYNHYFRFMPTLTTRGMWSCIIGVVRDNLQPQVPPFNKCLLNVYVSAHMWKPMCFSSCDFFLLALEKFYLTYLFVCPFRLLMTNSIVTFPCVCVCFAAHLNQEREKPVVFLTARVHPGESPASFICHGVIDFLVSQHPIAQVLRDHVVFKIVPMLNPDGVYLGNYRCSLMGFDLNRHWQDPSPWAHPTLHAVKQLIVQMNQDPKVSLEFYIDVHAHSTMMNGFMYGNVFEEEERVQRQAVFPRLLCHNAPDFSLSSTSFNRDVVKAGTGRRFLGGLLDDTSYCYTLEVSFYSYLTAGSTSPVPYTEDSYMKLGRNVARTFLDYYKLNNLIDESKLTGLIHSTFDGTSTSHQGNNTKNGKNQVKGEKKSHGVRQY